MNVARIAAVTGLALTLAACGMFGEAVRRPCPNFLILGEGGQMVRFKPGPGRDLTDVMFETKIDDFKGSCTHDDDNVSIDVTVDFKIERGAANREKVARFEYFLAIPRFYPAPEGKRIFPISIAFRENQSRVLFRDELTLEIPLKPGEVGANYDVYLSLQLKPDELEFNRKRRLN